ncbi:MAG: hypothetical protein ABIR32_18540 [Ilumatobacteraceae bacterium]
MAELWKPAVYSTVRRQVGIVSVVQMVDAGCSRREAYRLVKGEEFELVLPGILHSTHWPMGRDQLMIAACLRNPNAVIGFTTSCQDWRFRGVVKDDDVHILVPHSSSPILPGITVHRCRRIDPVDIVHRSNGTRITSPSRSLFDSADMLGVHRSTSILEQLVDQNRGTFVTHAGTFARLAAPGRPGTSTMQAVIASRPPWRAAMQSELELIVLTEITRQQLPAPELQFVWNRHGGGRVRFDFAWPSVRVALEVDHPFWHAGSQPSARDKRRDLDTAVDGWLTVRLTDFDVNGGLATAIHKLGLVLAGR